MRQWLAMFISSVEPNSLIGLFAEDSTPEERGPLLLARGLDIARGGNGQIATDA